MPKRLTSITTKTGDDGHTGLASMRRVKKNDACIHALGDVDECNSVIGLLLAEDIDDAGIRQCLSQIQQQLFWLGADLAMEASNYLKADAVAFLEQHIKFYNQSLPALQEFILPQGARPACLCHLARTVCRRAERSLVAVADLPPVILQYINRLSDLLFILARILNRAADVDEVECVFSR